MSILRSKCSFTLSEIDMQWTKLSFDSSFDWTKELDFMSIINKLMKTFMNSSELMQMQIIGQLHEILDPKSTNMCDLPLWTRKRGRPKGISNKKAKHDASTKRDPSGFESFKIELKSQKSVSKLKPKRQRKVPVVTPPWTTTIPLIKELPNAIRPYVSSITNVPSDGHCGFRATAASLGMGDDGWKAAKIDLMNGLFFHPNILSCLVGKKWWMNC